MYSEHSSVSSLSKVRKQVDLDAQVLANRIALLRQEGEKACKRLYDTRMKTREVEEIQKQQGIDHETFLLMRLQEIQTKQRATQLRRQHGRTVVQDAKAALLEKRRRDARKIREESHEMQESKKAVDEVQQRLIAERSALLKSHLVGEEKKKQLEETRAARIEQLREEKQARGTAEMQLILRTERRIAELEREETELMEWLTAKQMEQRAAYEDLAFAASRRHGGGAGSTHTSAFRQTM